VRCAGRHANYLDTPWLARRYAMTTLPTIASLRALRTFAANTANFFDAPGVRLGLLKPANDSPRYFTRPDGVREADDFFAITALAGRRVERDDDPILIATYAFFRDFAFS
jgi:hypothetical protein